MIDPISCLAMCRRNIGFRRIIRLRPIRLMTDAALAQLSARFVVMYSGLGRPSIPPEQLLRALLLQRSIQHSE